MAAPPPPLPRRDRPPLPDPRTFSPPGPQQPYPSEGAFSPQQQPSSPSSSISAPDLCQNGSDFGSCLQLNYDAISKRHEEELHSLESLRMHIFKRQKVDKEYSDSLQRINQSCERSAQFPVATTSPVVQAWKVFLQVSEKLQAQLSSSSDQMKSMIEVVDELIKNKRGAKKVSDDQRIQLDTEFTNMCNHVQDLRRDYRKHLRATEKCRNTLQSLHQKQAKANEVERSRIKRNILGQYCSCLDYTKLYEDSFALINDALSQVERESEYVQFIRDNAKDQAPIENFEFDGTLLSAPCAPSDVQAGQIVINNLTHKAMADK
uniref:FCH domain-containing protein n=1 Tax=Amphimedon queenslandica TaxID=400682 RepID=A0A1X7U1C3_AMPQE